jgi:hypothetical protein
MSQLPANAHLLLLLLLLLLLQIDQEDTPESTYQATFDTSPEGEPGRTYFFRQRDLLSCATPCQCSTQAARKASGRQGT